MLDSAEQGSGRLPPTRVTVIMNGLAGGRSGGDTHALYIVRALNARPHLRCSVIAPRGELGDEVAGAVVDGVANGVALFRLSRSYVFLFALYWVRIAQAAARLRASVPDVVIASSHLFHDVFPLVLARRATFVCYVHHLIGMQARRGLANRVATLLERLSLRVLRGRRALIFTGSVPVRDRLVVEGFDPASIVLSENGIPDGMRGLPLACQRANRVVFVGRLVPSKGVFDLLALARHLRDAGLPHVVTVVGSGPLREQLESQARDKGLGARIEMVGFVDEARKRELLGEAQLFILPSREEGWGIVIGEALAHGLPVVAYALPEIVPIWPAGVVFVPAGDVEAWSRAVVELLGDAPRRNALARAGHAHAQTLDWSDITRREIAQIERAASAAGTPAP